MSIFKRGIRLLDIYTSRLSSAEIDQYKKEITKQKNNPVCSKLSTNEVAARGIEAMRADGFRLMKGQFDV